MPEITPTHSLVIPAFNEDDRMGLCFAELNRFAELYKATGKSLELLIVDDGSRDATYAKARALMEALFKKFPFISGKVLQLETNQGKGAALQKGVIESRAPWVLTLDCDMATSPLELFKWNQQFGVPIFEQPKGQSVYIASREDPNSNVDDSWLRRLSGRCFNFLVRFLLGIKLSDTQCGFKLYSAESAKAAFSDLEEKGWAHDVEVLYKLKQMNVPIQSLPVKWTAVPSSKISLFRDSIRMAKTVFRLWLNRLRAPSKAAERTLP